MGHIASEGTRSQQVQNLPVPISKLRGALAEAKTIEDALRGLAISEAAEEAIRQMDLGREKQNEIGENVCEWWRLAGRFLKEIEKHPPGRPPKNPSQDVTDLPPTLKELGISNRMKSHRAQRMHDLPESKFRQLVSEILATTNGIITANAVYKAARAWARLKRRKTEKATGPYPPKIIISKIQDAHKLVAAGSVDYVITDPPYPEEYLPLFGELARFCLHALKDGGSLICMSGQYHLPEVFRRLCDSGLSYQWTLAYRTPGAPLPVNARCVNTSWKPLLWLTKGPYAGEWIGDVTKSPAPDKDSHGWGQSVEGMKDVVRRFGKNGDVVCDPFVGGGGTAVAAYELERRFVGLDSDEAAIAETKRRLGL